MSKFPKQFLNCKHKDEDGISTIHQNFETKMRTHSHCTQCGLTFAKLKDEYRDSYQDKEVTGSGSSGSPNKTAEEVKMKMAGSEKALHEFMNNLSGDKKEKEGKAGPDKMMLVTVLLSKLALDAATEELTEYKSKMKELQDHLDKAHARIRGLMVDNETLHEDRHKACKIETVLKKSHDNFDVAMQILDVQTGPQGTRIIVAG